MRRPKKVKRRQVNIRLTRDVWRALQAVARIRNLSAQTFSERVLVEEIVRAIEGTRHAKS